MTDNNKVEIKDIAQAPAKAIETATNTAADTAKSAVTAATKATTKAVTAAKRGRPVGSRNGTAARRAKRKTAGTTARKTSARKTSARKTSARKTTARKSTARRTATQTTIKAARDTASTAQERIINMFNSNTPFNGFAAIPAFAPFQSMFANAGERSQDAANKGQKVAEQMADLTRSNVEAMVEASRVAVEGARSIGQDMVAKGRNGVELASDAIRSLAEAKSPTEYMQLQSEFARASFDRMVNEGSKLTESMVKLAGEAFQPLQNRASANADRFNTLVA